MQCQAKTTVLDLAAGPVSSFGPGSRVSPEHHRTPGPSGFLIYTRPRRRNNTLLERQNFIWSGHPLMRLYQGNSSRGTEVPGHTRSFGN